MTLRDQCVEAAARAGYAGDAWDYVDELQRDLWRVDAGLAFDAILDTLEANADEVRLAAQERVARRYSGMLAQGAVLHFSPNTSDVCRILAALRA